MRVKYFLNKNFLKPITFQKKIEKILKNIKLCIFK